MKPKMYQNWGKPTEISAARICYSMFLFFTLKNIANIKVTPTRQNGSQATTFWKKTRVTNYIGDQIFTFGAIRAWG